MDKTDEEEVVVTATATYRGRTVSRSASFDAQMAIIRGQVKCAAQDALTSMQHRFAKAVREMILDEDDKRPPVTADQLFVELEQAFADLRSARGAIDTLSRLGSVAVDGPRKMMNSAEDALRRRLAEVMK